MSIIRVFTLPFMQRAIIGGVIVSLLASSLGVFVTLRKQAFITDAIAHASLAGVATGLLLDTQPILIALLVGVVVSVGITYFYRKGGVGADSVIGIFFTVFFAIGILLINLSPTYQPELMTYLFGSVLSISWNDLLYAGGVLIVVAVLLWRFYYSLLYLAFDREAAYVRGVRVRILEYVLNVGVSLAVIVSVKTVGIILATALFIIPASSARLVVRTFGQMIPLSVVFGVVAVLGGLIGAFYLDIPPGATIVLFSGIIFVLISIVRVFVKRPR